MSSSPSIYKLPKGDKAEFIQCMPDIYKSNNPIQGYRNYYIGEKQHIATWKNRPIPNWFTRNKIK